MMIVGGRAVGKSAWQVQSAMNVREMSQVGSQQPRVTKQQCSAVRNDGNGLLLRCSLLQAMERRENPALFFPYTIQLLILERAAPDHVDFSMCLRLCPE